MRESDLIFRLENGAVIWGFFWKYEKLLIILFISVVIIKDIDFDVDFFLILELDLEFLVVIFFDVVVLKCLSLIGWDENGVVWVFRYLAVYFKKEFNFFD